MGQARRVNRLEAALRSRHPLDRPSRDWLGNPLELAHAEVAQTKEIAEQPARGGADDDRPRFGEGLEAGGEVRRLADQRALAQRTPAAEVAHPPPPRPPPKAPLERIPPA